MFWYMGKLLVISIVIIGFIINEKDLNKYN